MSIDWGKIGRGAAIAVGGALVAYMATVIPTIEQSGAYGAVVAAVASILIQAARKWLEALAAK